MSAVAWRFDDGTDPPKDGVDVHFWEYNSHTPDGKPVDTSKRFSVSRQLTEPADAQLIANYSDPTWVLGGNWKPKDSPIFTQKGAMAAPTGK